MAAGQTLVSIGVPVYNGETFLHQTLESLLAQDYENLEINISDNGSTDGTAAICQEFASRDPRIKFHQNAKNLGSAANFRRVFELAEGRYFMWAGNHDLWHPSFISSCVEVLENDPKVVLAYTRTLLIDKAGNPIELMPDTIDTRGLNAVESYLKIIRELGYCNMFYGIFRVEILRELNFHRRVIIGPDNVSLAWVSLQGSIAQVTRPLFYRRDSFPGETSEQAQNRRINMTKQDGLEYEAIIPYTLLAYAHLELIAESNLSGSEKDFLAKETIGCFFSSFSSKMDQERYSLLAALRNISMDGLPEMERDRLFRLIKAVKTFFPDTQLPDSQNEAGQVLDLDSVKPTPFISIVIPTYNRAVYIKDAIHSALAQNYEHLEILIVDDGSTDNTQAVVASFVSDKIRYVCKEHTGAPSTRNRGVREAKGDFILWLDSDDVLLPDTVRSYVSLLQQFPDTDVCYGDLVITDDTLDAKGKLPYEDWFGRNAELLARLFMVNCIPNPGTMVRRACFERVGMFDESFRRAHDYEWWTRLAPVANFRHAPLTVVKWRWHDSNMSSGSVNIDWSFDARIVHLMMARHSLPELFPQVDFSRLQPQVAAGLTYMHAAQRLLDLQDIAGAIRYIKLSHELHPDGQKLTLIQELNALLPSPDKEQDNEKVSSSPMVSVIVPTYNRPEMLVQTIQSILDQTYKDHEIIVVNDCGLEVESIVAWLNQQQNITYVRHGRNRGLAAARNTGIGLARGKYLAYLDDDDIFYPDHLETLVTFLETSNCRVAYTDALRAIQVKKQGRYATVDRDLLYSHEFDADRLIVANQFPVLCLMHERACLEQAGLFDESLTTHEDWDLWIRLSFRDKFAHIKKITCEFSWRDDGSTMSSARTQDFVRTMEIIYAKYQQHLCDKPHIRAMQRQFLQEQKVILGCAGSGAEAKGPKSDDLLAQATIALDKQDWATAEGHLRELNRRFADLLEPYLVLSDILTMQGKHQEALAILRQAQQIDADALPLLKRLGINSRQRGDLSSALAAFTRAWNQAPQDSEMLGHLSSTCLDLGLHDEAKHYYRQALEGNPKNIELWLGLARVARQLGDRETLEEATHEAASLNPGHPRVLELTKTRIPAGGSAATPLPIQEQSCSGTGSARVPASIIIPVFNNLELTQNCLESIWEHTPPELFEIIVVDNGSSDGTPAFLKHLAAAGKIRHIPNEKNLGYAKACNQAARSARGDYLIMLNNDTLVTDGWLNALIEAVEKNDHLAIVGAKLLYPNDSVQHAGVVFNQKGKVYHIYRYFHRDHPAVNKTREFQVVTAACQLIRTSVFLQVGLFDEGFLNGFEDVDLCLRVGQLGYGILYNPDCVVYHLESMTPGRGADDSENSRYFTEKWQGRPMVPDDFRYYEEDGLRMEWVTDLEGGQEAVIHDQNDNPYKQEARACLNQGDLAGAMALYNLALRFNPFDPRNRALIAEMETLKDMAEPRSQAVHG